VDRRREASETGNEEAPVILVRLRMLPFAVIGVSSESVANREPQRRTPLGRDGEERADEADDRPTDPGERRAAGRVQPIADATAKREQRRRQKCEERDMTWFLGVGSGR
jgi:hypothetical protein